MEDRVTRLERKLAALKGNVEGLHEIRVSVDNHIITMMCLNIIGFNMQMI